MYEDAAKEKAGEENIEENANDENFEQKDTIQSEMERYHLAETDHVMEGTHIPSPVAIPNGELGELMNDIIDQQKEQPWLVSSQARAPTISTEKEIVSEEHVKREKEISKSLRLELERKRKAATEWANKNPETKAKPTKKKDGFSPQRFHSMLSARERLPACQMAEKIVSTIKSNQITGKKRA